MPNKESVEAMPFGNISINIVGSQFWENEGYVKQLLEVVQHTLNQAINEKKLRCESLRLIVVAADFPKEVIRWQQQITGEATGVSSSPEGEAFGKTLIWYTDKTESPYAIIILKEEVAWWLINGDLLGSAVLIHELAHVHADYLLYHSNIPQVTATRLNDWAALQQAIAQWIWSEFFASFVAHPYLRDRIDAAVTGGIDRLQGVHQRVTQEIAAYRNHGDMGKLWSFVVTELSDGLLELGRTIGILTAARHNGDNHFDQFLAEIDKVSSSWGLAVRRLAVGLAGLEDQEQFSLESFDRLCEVVQYAFRAMGLYPEPRQAGLWVEVP